MECDRAVLEEFYGRYLRCCNEYRFAELGEFVDEDVEVNGGPMGRREYVAGVAAVIEIFSDFQWDLRHLLVDRCWLSAHLIDTWTARDGRSVSIQEFALYRVADGRIAASWGDLDRGRLAVL